MKEKSSLPITGRFDDLSNCIVEQKVDDELKNALIGLSDKMKETANTGLFKTYFDKFKQYTKIFTSIYGHFYPYLEDFISS